MQEVYNTQHQYNQQVVPPQSPYQNMYQYQLQTPIVQYNNSNMQIPPTQPVQSIDNSSNKHIVVKHLEFNKNNECPSDSAMLHKIEDLFQYIMSYFVIHIKEYDDTDRFILEKSYDNIRTAVFNARVKINKLLVIFGNSKEIIIKKIDLLHEAESFLKSIKNELETLTAISFMSKEMFDILNSKIGDIGKSLGAFRKTLDNKGDTKNETNKKPDKTE